MSSPAFADEHRSWKHAVYARASPDAVWAVLIDGPRWGEWNPDVAWMWVDEGLTPGAYLTIKPRRGRQTAYVIEDVVRIRRFAIRLQFGPAAQLHLAWNLAPGPNGGTHVEQSIEIGGFAAGFLVRKRAERLAANMPAALAKLVEIARA